MNEMVERVARALAPASWQALTLSDSLAHENRRKASLRHAVAAIRAMREPTPQILAAMNGQLAYVDGTTTSAWRAGIGAAWGEPDGPVNTNPV